MRGVLPCASTSSTMDAAHLPSSIFTTAAFDRAHACRKDNTILNETEDIVSTNGPYQEQPT